MSIVGACSVAPAAYLVPPREVYGPIVPNPTQTSVSAAKPKPAKSPIEMRLDEIERDIDALKVEYDHH